MDISFIIVNYKSKNFLKNCISSVTKNLSDCTWEIIIVNNDETVLEKAVGLALPNLRIINHLTNDGFAKACNIGAEDALGKILFFLNPDTEIRNLDFNAISKSLNQTGIGILAPQIITPTGNIQKWSYGEKITLLTIIKNNLGLAKNDQSGIDTISMEVDWASGCALAIKKSVFDQLSGFDENFFMYFEDVDLCKRTQKLGKKIITLPEMQVLHFGGQSFAGIKKQKKDYYASQDYYFKKHRPVLELFFLKRLRDIVSFFKN